ncbi:unnamed protein product [Symbiodinium necroappetens]|uniref:Uncharacterized protein n=1 Tax=Symbiodinium necroappetens TaxID=1628268 RepID=A0A812KWV1_9DINO|nr:unnamed protein product [Symbiodinium necroappetens]
MGPRQDPNRIFLARRINKLGFRAQEELWLHYSKYGPVEKVLVANAKARNSRLHPQGKLRPGSLAIVVMETAATVKEIMALGEEQLVGGQVIKLQKFEPTAPKGRSGGMKHHMEMSTSPAPADPQGSSFSGSGGSGPETKGKQEDGREFWVLRPRGRGLQPRGAGVAIALAAATSRCDWLHLLHVDVTNRDIRVSDMARNSFDPWMQHLAISGSLRKEQR